MTTGASNSRQHTALSGDGRRLAFVEKSISRNIWKVAFDPSAGAAVDDPVPVTQGSRRATNPDPSPDGKWLAHDSIGDLEDIFVIRTDGTGRRRLTNDLHRDRFPRWSPDGSKIAFYSNRSGWYEIWSINPDGSGLEQLTDTPGQSVNFAVWAPDGKRMAYYNRTEGLSYIFEPENHGKSKLPSHYHR